MKDRTKWVAGSLIISAVCWSAPAMGDSDAVAAAASAVESGAAMDVAEDAAGETVDAAVQTVDEAADSVEEAIETVQGISEEMGVADEVAEAGDELSDDVAATQADGELGYGGETGYGGGQMQANMAEWMANSMPSEHHARLDPFVGSWDVTMRYWMAPGMPPQVSAGTSEIKWILGGRFIQENFVGTMQMPGSEPQAFEGMGITGYDNAKGEYVGTWSDSMTTGIISSVGQFDESSQTLTQRSSFDCPMDGPSSMRMTIQVVGPDELLLQAFKTSQGKQEAKIMEINYKRHVGEM